MGAGEEQELSCSSKISLETPRRKTFCHCRAYTSTCPRIAGRWRLAGDERNGDGTESRARPTRALPYDDHIRGTVPGLLNDGADRPPDLELGPALAESSLQSVADAG